MVTLSLAWSYPQLLKFFIPRVMFAIICGGLIGLERELKNKPAGITLLIVNTLNTATPVNLPFNAEQYTLTANELQTKKVQLNGQDLALTANDQLPVIKGKAIGAGVIQIPPHSITFLTFSQIKK